MICIPWAVALSLWFLDVRWNKWSTKMTQDGWCPTSADCLDLSEPSLCLWFTWKQGSRVSTGRRCPEGNLITEGSPQHLATWANLGPMSSQGCSTLGSHLSWYDALLFFPAHIYFPLPFWLFKHGINISFTVLKSDMQSSVSEFPMQLSHPDPLLLCLRGRS